jgi:hypothetical protein
MMSSNKGKQQQDWDELTHSAEMAYMAGYDLKTNVMHFAQTSTSAASSLLREHEYCSVGYATTPIAHKHWLD